MSWPVRHWQSLACTRLLAWLRTQETGLAWLEYINTEAWIAMKTIKTCIVLADIYNYSLAWLGLFGHHGRRSLATPERSCNYRIRSLARPDQSGNHGIRSQARPDSSWNHVVRILVRLVLFRRRAILCKHSAQASSCFTDIGDH